MRVADLFVREELTHGKPAHGHDRRNERDERQADPAERGDRGHLRKAS